MPTFSALLLAACSPVSPDPEGPGVECALDGSEEFEQNCVLEVVQDSDEFIIHHPDGGFRRFGSDPDGGHMALDGADELTASYGFDGDNASFAIGGDRYRMKLSMLPERRGD